MNNGGIQMNVLQPDDEEATGIARYQDILVRGCHIKNVSRAGMVIGYTYQNSKFQGAEISDATVQRYGHGNVVVENNYVQNAGNDAIVVMYADSPQIRNNVSDHAGADMATYTSYWQNFCAAIWPWKCKDAVLERNEAFDTQGENNGDGQAWDIDWSDGTIYQYNYSHHNGGGALLTCLSEAYQGVFRYNVSQNDLGALLTLQGNPNVQVYNNVFYVDGDLSTRVHNQASGKNSGEGWIANNIFYNVSSNNPNDAWQPGGENQVFTNNLYCGYDTVPQSDAKAVTVAREDAESIFVDPGCGPTGTNGAVHTADAFAGYKLKADSPAINKGTFVTGGAENDFFGNAVGRIPDIGIHETDTPEEVLVDVVSNVYRVTDTEISKVPYDTSVEEFMENIVYSNGITCRLYASDGTTEKTGSQSIVTSDKLRLTYNGQTKEYTIQVDAEDLSVMSLNYDVTETAIQEVERGTTVETFLANLTYGEGLTVKVYAGDVQKESSAVVLDGDILKITGKSGDIREYTIRTRKIYEEYSVSGMTADQGSYQSGNTTEGAGSLALDNNINTMWHTDWNGTARENCWISIDMGEAKEVAMLKYVPRTPVNNGVITKYQIFTSTDGQSWTEATLLNGDAWEFTSDVKYAYFESVEARYVKLYAVESYSNQVNNNFASAAEIRLGYEVKEVEE